MIELPRAALLADKVAQSADFFSFGTNDLTQMTYGLSRDDMGKFFPAYQREGLMPSSPLAEFDIDGVGQLVQIGTERGRSTKPRLKVGVWRTWWRPEWRWLLPSHRPRLCQLFSISCACCAIGGRACDPGLALVAKPLSNEFIHDFVSAATDG